MKTLIEALVRLYEISSLPPAAEPTEAAKVERKLLDPASHDAGTFPYLP